LPHRRTAQIVPQPLSSAVSEPVTGVVKEAVVPHQYVGVVAPAFPVQGIGFRFGERAREALHTDHGCCLPVRLSSCCWIRANSASAKRSRMWTTLSPVKTRIWRNLRTVRVQMRVLVYAGFSVLM